jgi:hypothetical protein
VIVWGIHVCSFFSKETRIYFTRDRTSKVTENLNCYVKVDFERNLIFKICARLSILLMTLFYNKSFPQRRKVLTC